MCHLNNIIMNRTEILKTLQEIIVNKNLYHIDNNDNIEEVLAEDVYLYDDLDFDSLDICNLAVALEEHYGVEIDEYELIDADTIGGVVNYLMKTLQIF